MRKIKKTTICLVMAATFLVPAYSSVFAENEKSGQEQQMSLE